jgi:hypothetical protein
LVAPGEGGKPPENHWDDAAAAIDKVVLIGLTHYRAEHDEPEYEQMHGVIVSADRKKGFRVELLGRRAGEEYWLPPQTSNLVPAPKGTYRLKSTAEEVVDPDYTSTWTITPPVQ